MSKTYNVVSISQTAERILRSLGYAVEFCDHSGGYYIISSTPVSPPLPCLIHYAYLPCGCVIIEEHGTWHMDEQCADHSSEENVSNYNAASVIAEAKKWLQDHCGKIDDEDETKKEERQ